MTLTEASYLTRRTIRLTVFLVIILVTARLLWLTGFKVYRRFVPEPPPTPTVSFGKLPKINFPTRENLPEFSFLLETPEGGLPKTQTIEKVYFMPRPIPYFLALDQARAKANRLGFTGGEEKISDTLYRFRNPRSSQILEMNIVSGAFSVRYDLEQDPQLPTLRPESSEVAAAAVRSFLSSAGLLSDDLADGKITYVFFKKITGGITSVVSLSEANFVKVNIFRHDFDSLPVVPPDVADANVWFLVSGAREREKQIVAGEYHYFAVDSQQSSTYPLKTSDEAFSELKEGGGFIAKLGQNQDGKVTIRRVFLAYFDPEEPQDFMQPIFVFEGDRNFSAYVPAITADYYSQE